MIRADAARNRELIVDAAYRAFGERGLEVPLEEIAGEAGVGIATLYRRFATRDELLAAVAQRHMEAYERALRRAQADPDAWQGFSSFVRTIAEIQARHAGMADVLISPCPGTPDGDDRAMAVYDGYLDLVRRAKESGRLRRDYSPEDLPLMLMANAGVLRATAKAAPRAWKRLVEYLLQAFSCPSRRNLPAAPTAPQMARALKATAD